MNEVNQPMGDGKTVISASSSGPKIFIALGAVALILLTVVGVGIYCAYVKVASDKFTLGIAKVFNLPAAKVGDEKVLYTDFVEDLDAIHTMVAFSKAKAEAAGQTPADAGPTEEDMKRDVMVRLVNNLVTERLAQDKGVGVADEDVKTVRDKLLAKFKDEAALNTELTDRYGWNLADYEKKVIRPFILQSNLAKKLQEPVRAEAEKVLEEIKTGGDFAALAKEYSDDGSAANGGDLGWFPKGQMVAPFEKAVFSLKKGEVYPTLVETEFGYHIIKLDDRRVTRVKNDKGMMVNQEQARASHILFSFVDLMRYVNDELEKNRPKVYIKMANPFEKTKATGSVLEE